MDSLRNGTHCAPCTLGEGERSCATGRIAPTSSARATNAGPAACAPLAPTGRDALPVDPDHSHRSARAASARWRRRDLPVPGRPSRPCPLFDPGRRHRTQTRSDRGWRLRMQTASTPQRCSFGLNYAACTLPVDASQQGFTPNHATPGSGWGPAWPVRSLTCWVAIEGFRHVSPSTCLPPSPSFARRNRMTFLPEDVLVAESKGLSG